MISLVISLAVLLSAIMAFAWLLQRVTGNSGWVDAVWSFGLGVAGLVAALAPLGGPVTGRQVTVAVLIAGWSLRLGMHIAARSRSGPEDARYAFLRREWGTHFQARLFWFLQIQAAAAFVLAVSVLLAARNPAPGIGGLDYLGASILLISIVGEAFADNQLRDFKADPENRGKVCDVGLWAWSRHPNYFFEWLGWIAYPLFAIDLSGAWLWGWAATSGPVFMYLLLVRASGIPPLEAHMLRSRGAAFRAYQARTSAFFPAPPKANPTP